MADIEKNFAYAGIAFFGLLVLAFTYGVQEQVSTYSAPLPALGYLIAGIAFFYLYKKFGGRKDDSVVSDRSQVFDGRE